MGLRSSFKMIKKVARNVIKKMTEPINIIRWMENSPVLDNIIKMQMLMVLPY